MNDTTQNVLAQLTEIIDQLLSGKSSETTFSQPLAPTGDPTIDALAEKIQALNSQHQQFAPFILDLANGKLSSTPPRGNSFANPFKQLHSELKHLTWQIKQISDGDYSQEVTFSGDFSQAINKMILDLRERRVLSDLLKESNQTKDKLFSIIAHDLKNPFNTLVGMSQLLMAEVEAGRTQNIGELAQAIHEAGSSGYALLINLLEWSRLQSKRIIVQPMPATLRTIILGNIYHLNPTAKAKGITIQYADTQEYPVVSDSNILNTVLRNLISNAIKYSHPQGCIEVSVTHPKPGMHLLWVKDYGVGMRPEAIDKLFRVDTQKSTRGTNNEEGTGLGLALCKDLVRLINGEIRVESTYGRGSTFAITVPDMEPAYNHAQILA